MGEIMSAYDYRIRRAVNLVLDGKVEQSTMPHHWWVQSQGTDGVEYLVKLRIDWEEQPGEVLETGCSRYERKGHDGPYDKVGPGPDWQRQLNAMDDAVVYGYSPCNPGICQVNLNPVCKHVLSVLLHIQAIPWPEWAEPLTLDLPPVVISAAEKTAGVR